MVNRRVARVALLVAALLGACSEDKRVVHGPPSSSSGDGSAPAGNGDYPPGPYELKTLGIVPPGMTFEGLDGTVSIDALYDPKAESPKLAVIRTSAAWCGTCLWHASHTKRLLEDPRFEGRLTLVDLLVADRDNVAADRNALTEWRSKIDAPQTLAIDPHYSFGPALLSRSPLPEYVFIDTRTMKILRTASNPGPADLTTKIAISLAEIDGTKKPPVEAPPLTDGFTEDQMDLIRGMKIDESFAPPPDPTNAVADHPKAVELGKLLFNDTKLSPSGKVSCGTCHDQGLELADGKAQSEGVAKVDRNSPGVALSAHSRWQFWDGRADTLWAQALGPFEDAKEFGGSRLFVAHRIADAYAAQYAELFDGDLKAIGALPANGKPGDADYDALSAADKEKVTRVFVNVGKSIAAFERAIRVKPNMLDAYAGGDLTALSKAQKTSLRNFMVNGCAQCHWGPRLTDDAFHVLRFPTGRQDKKADRGRADGLTRLAASAFRASSTWSDAPTTAKTFDVATAPAFEGAFKTPTLRGVATSAPFGHGGTVLSLGEVAATYGTRGINDSDPRAVGHTEDWVPIFDQSIVLDLPTFLEVLTAPIVLP
ncbi:MAG: cytochrome c peroxidase [Labilithrix sp.]